MNGSTHPAESPEFLSRLHDGELSVPEAASFEEHRKSCARCRESADSYSRALRIFRSASPRPPASDLGARILRKVRAQAPSRRPFGVMFGIDIRWAGVCAAALVVVIMAASILDEGPMPSIVLPEARRSAEPESVRARLLEREGPASKPKRQAAAKTAPAAPELTSARGVTADADRAPRDQAAAAPPSAAAEFAPEPRANAAPSVQAAAPLTDSLAKLDENKVASRRDEVAQSTETKKELQNRPAANEASGREGLKADSRSAPVAGFISPPRSRITAPAEAPGGEAGSIANDVAESPAIRLLVRPVDGFGSPPALEPGTDPAPLASLRGREFVLVVESGGRVRSAAVSADSGALNLREKDKASGAREDLSALLALRFAPGDRPRRLVLRVQ
jgi:hypothetical protein